MDPVLGNKINLDEHFVLFERVWGQFKASYIQIFQRQLSKALHLMHDPKNLYVHIH